jgi:hypothetical protein
MTVREAQLAQHRHWRINDLGGCPKSPSFSRDVFRNVPGAFLGGPNTAPSETEMNANTEGKRLSAKSNEARLLARSSESLGQEWEAR